MKTTSFLSITFLFLVLFSSCSHLPGNRPVVHIGDTLQNGIVFYVDASKQHGMVCGLADLGNAPWDTTLFDVQHYELYNPPFIGGTDTSLGAGAANTTAIINRIGNGNYAAALCRNSNEDGFSTWSLPSKAELALIYTNLKLAGLGNFATENPFCSDCGVFYWSSSEIDYRDVWCQRFDTGEQVNYAWKNNTFFIRAVRSF